MDHAQQRKMYGTLKSFDSKEHATYDSKGKDAGLIVADWYFGEENTRTIENPDRHGIDLLTLNENDEVVACWEVEVRHGNWRGDIEFPFRDINCIERKDHQWRKDKTFTNNIPFKLSDSYQVFYVQFNKECTRAVIIDGDVVLEHPLKPWSNRKAQGEYVRQVPVDKATQVLIKL